MYQGGGTLACFQGTYLEREDYALLPAAVGFDLCPQRDSNLAGPRENQHIMAVAAPVQTEGVWKGNQSFLCRCCKSQDPFHSFYHPFCKDFT